MDPPGHEAVHHAVERLAKLGALQIQPDSCELLTPLGRTLAQLPLDPATGRMLIMGVVMKCLDPVVTAAACFSSRNVFYNPPGLRDEAQKIRKSFSSSSDTAAQIIAYNEFWSLVEDVDWDEACSWAKENYVSIAAMISIKAIRSELLSKLRKAGLIDLTDLDQVRPRECALRSDSHINQNADNELLSSAVLACSIPNNISSRRQLGNFGTLRSRLEGHCEIHPSSVNFFRKPPKARLPAWYLYREMVLSSGVFIRDCSSIRPEQLLLFGGYSLTLSGGARPVHVLDDWIVTESKCKDTISLLTTARKDITAALEHKAMYPRLPLPLELQGAIDSICDMFEVLDEENADGRRSSTRDTSDFTLMWGMKG
jgi:HrpA-like RNA helicase